MVVADQRIFLKNAAFMRIREMRLQRDQAILPGEPQKLIQHFEQFVVGLLAEGRALERRQQPLHQVLEHLDGRHDDQRAEGGAADRQDFGGMDERGDLSARKDESAQNGADHNDASDDNDHVDLA